MFFCKVWKIKPLLYYYIRKKASTQRGWRFNHSMEKEKINGERKNWNASPRLSKQFDSRTDVRVRKFTISSEVTESNGEMDCCPTPCWPCKHSGRWASFFDYSPTRSYFTFDLTNFLCHKKAGVPVFRQMLCHMKFCQLFFMCTCKKLSNNCKKKICSCWRCFSRLLDEKRRNTAPENQESYNRRQIGFVLTLFCARSMLTNKRKQKHITKGLASFVASLPLSTKVSSSTCH